MKQDPSIGMDLFSKTIIVNGENIKINIWDTAGQDKYFSLTKSLFQKADGVLLTFDLTDLESFKSNSLLLLDICVKYNINMWGSINNLNLPCACVRCFNHLNVAINWRSFNHSNIKLKYICNSFRGIGLLDLESD